MNISLVKRINHPGQEGVLIHPFSVLADLPLHSIHHSFIAYTYSYPYRLPFITSFRHVGFSIGRLCEDGLKDIALLRATGVKVKPRNAEIQTSLLHHTEFVSSTVRRLETFFSLAVTAKLTRKHFNPRSFLKAICSDRPFAFALSDLRA